MFVGSMVPQKGIDKFAALVEGINNSARLREPNKFINFGSGALTSRQDFKGGS
jgi:hypothetical protein